MPRARTPRDPERSQAAARPRRSDFERQRRRHHVRAPAASAAAATTSTTRRPRSAGLQGAGTVHHIAWAAPPEDQDAWQRARGGAPGAHATPIIDRHYFRSIYFREPSGVLFEIATLGPGFTVDEPLEHLGEKLSLTPQYEHLREQIEPTLTPLRNPRESWAQSVGAASRRPWGRRARPDRSCRPGGCRRQRRGLRRRTRVAHQPADRHRREVLSGQLAAELLEHRHHRRRRCGR